MTDMYEAGELLDRVQRIVDQAGDKVITQTPDGNDPVYWPITIHGKTAMYNKESYDQLINDTIPPLDRSSSSKDQSAQT